MEYFQPKKEMYFIVTEVRIKTRTELIKQKPASIVKMLFEVVKPKRLKLYYCEFNESDLIKGLPVAYLDEVESIFEFSKPEYFEKDLTIFKNPPPAIMSEFKDIVESFENRDKNIRTKKLIIEELEVVKDIEQEEEIDNKRRSIFGMFKFSNPFNKKIIP